MYACRDYDKRFDVIDLDPYGTAAPFLDAAVQVSKTQIKFQDINSEMLLSPHYVRLLPMVVFCASLVPMPPCSVEHTLKSALPYMDLFLCDIHTCTKCHYGFFFMLLTVLRTNIADILYLGFL
jgi:hypothetical protein